LPPTDQDIAGFIRSSFRSIWTLELLLHLARTPDRSWTAEELVRALRASESIVAQGLDALLAAGLIVRDEAAGARFRPASTDLAALTDGAARLYAQRPDAVRRLIVGASGNRLSAFADAFRLRRD
jgi:DNA-binding IclR family transcriptional regulator